MFFFVCVCVYNNGVAAKLRDVDERADGLSL